MLRAPRPPERVTPGMALGALLAFHVAVFGALVRAQHHRFASLGFDTGIYDQGIWLLSRGLDPFITVRGMDHWGHHVALVDLAFAVPYRLFDAGVPFLAAAHAAWLAFGAVPLYLLARDRWGAPWLALAAPAAFLLHPAQHWLTWWLYHPDSMAVPPLLAAWWLATRRRWGWFAVAIAVALACKEDVALAVAAMGVAVGIRTSRRAGVATVLAGAAWFLVCTRLVIPARNDHAPPFYESYFPTLGASLGEIVRSLVLHPSRPGGLLARGKNLRYALELLGPLGLLVPLLGGVALLLATPQLGVNLLVEVQDGATLRSQYASLPLVGASLGAVEGIGLLRRRPALLRVAALWLALCSTVGTVALGLGPVGLQGPFADDAASPWARRRLDHDEVAAALRVVPADARVSAAWDLVAQLTHRRVAYEFPNPWRSSNYGPSGNDVGDPSTVDWVVIDRVALGGDDLDLYAQLVAPGGGFEEVVAGRSVRVARRTGPDRVVRPVAPPDAPTLDPP